MLNYPFTIRQLSDDDGGGYLAEAIDLPGCMSDGETPEEAAHNIQDAIECWIEAAKAAGREIPSSSNDEDYSGKWLMRVPKTLHRKLVEASKRERVSLNTLAVSFLSEGIGSHKL
jgi:antitoxin HicB